MGVRRWIWALAWVGAACGGAPGGLDSSDPPDAAVRVDTGPGGACAAVEDGAACDDGDPCTENDRCLAGTCAGDPVECLPASDCETAACNPSTGACESQPVADDTPCEDGDLCTVRDVCLGGSCVPGEAVTCDGSATCVVGACNPATGECEGEPVADGTPCENECVVANGRCRQGQCRGTPRLCESPGDCREGLGCNPRTGCEYDNRPDGTTCSDDDACTNLDACEEGVCVGRPLVCPEPETCKAAVCDPEVGCMVVDAPDDTACDDADACSFESVCRSGECVATAGVECPVATCMASNDCNPATGRCEPAYAAIGTACNDANVCTEDEFCACEFGDTCTQTVCTGGTEIPWTGTPCSDGICFTEVTSAAGITWTTPSNPPHGHAASAVMADLDGDGWTDIILASESAGPTLYINDQQGGFTDETAGSGLTVTHTSTGACQGITAGDYDDDGDLDLYISYRGPNFMLENDGSAGFTDVTAATGTQDFRSSTYASFGDMDEDGDLDLIVGNYVAKQGSFFPNHIGMPNSVFRNNGDGTYTDVASALGIMGAGTATAGATLIVVFTDYDLDGDADILECNDFGQTVQPNRLYENDGTGSFTDVSVALGADVELFCMGVAVGDYDRDLDLDYYLTSIGHHIFLSGGTSAFSDVTAATRTRLENDDCFTQQKQAGWATVLEDFDYDGWPDLFVVNGYVVADTTIQNPVEQENKLLKNRGTGFSFRDISKSAGVTSKSDARGLGIGDYDHDGDIDLVVVNMTGAPELYRNDSPNLGRYIVLSLRGRVSDHFAHNAIVRADFEDYVTLKEYGVRPVYASSSPTELYLGAASETEARAITVDWPSGIHSQVLAVPTDTQQEIVEPVVTLEGFSVESGFAAGVQLTATATLTNHWNVAHAVDLDVELWDEAHNVLSTARVNRTVSAGGSSLVDVSVSVPASLPPGDVRWVASVSDVGGGVDQEVVEP